MDSVVDMHAPASGRFALLDRHVEIIDKSSLYAMSIGQPMVFRKDMSITA